MKPDLRYVERLDSWCNALGVTMGEVLQRSKARKRVNQARQIVAFMLHKEPSAPSNGEIGHLLQRDNSTICVSIQRVQEALVAREAWAVDALERCQYAAPATLELESPIDTVRRCSWHSGKPLDNSGTVAKGEVIELAEVGT